MKVEKPVPCVIYLHGNSGSRIDADDIVDSYLAERIAVFSIDFGGCGLSEGEYVTLGWRERDDLECVLDYLSGDKNTACIALFGRSMGAATALLVASDDRSVWNNACSIAWLLTCSQVCLLTRSVVSSPGTTT